MAVKRNRKRFTTTFNPDFIKLIKSESSKRGITTNKFIEKSVAHYIDKEKKIK